MGLLPMYLLATMLCEIAAVRSLVRLCGSPFDAVPNITLAVAHHDQAAQDEIAPLSANVNEALRIVSKLEQLGLDKQQISLPKCVVLGACNKVSNGQQASDDRVQDNSQLASPP